jgi:F0F1-type ATP synthase epsilon subunit
LNRHPVLKQFLLEEAETYQGVAIEWVKGRPAVLTVHKDGVESMKVDLHKFETKAELHGVFQELGFPLRSEEELEVLKQKLEERAALEKKQRAERLAAARESTNRHREGHDGQRHQYQPLKTTAEGSDAAKAEL